MFHPKNCIYLIKNISFKISLFTFITVVLTFSGCNTQPDYNTIDTFASPTTVNCVIEISAGTNTKFEINKKTNTFDVAIIDGKERIKPYLPLPGNYGFIPSTLSSKNEGGDGDAIDVLLLSQALPTGTVIEAIPIAMLKLMDAGQADDKIICIPKDPELRVIDATTLAETESKYPKALEIIQLWFQFSDPKDSTIIKGYVDEIETMAEIRRLQASYYVNEK